MQSSFTISFLSNTAGGTSGFGFQIPQFFSIESFYQMLDTNTISDNLPESFSSLKNESNN